MVLPGGGGPDLRTEPYRGKLVRGERVEISMGAFTDSSVESMEGGQGRLVNLRGREPVDSLAPPVDLPLKSFLSDPKALVLQTEQLQTRAADVSDPISSRVAFELLAGSHNKFTWEGRAEVRGLIPLSIHQLCETADHMNLQTDPTKIELEPALAALADGPVTPAALDAVLRMAREMKFPELKERCQRQLEGWQKAGLFVVEGGTDLSKPGLVIGNKLLLTPLPEATQEVLAGIPTRDWVYARPFDPAPGLDRLEQLARDNPKLAQSIVGDMISRDLDRDTHQKLVQLMARAVQSEPLKKLLEPHLDRLVDFADRAEAHGLIHRRWGSGEWQAAHYDYLSQLFPQTVDEQLPARLCPMVLAIVQPVQNAGTLLARLWKEHPELVQPTLDALTQQHPSVAMNEPALKLLQEAANEHGWRPNERETAWLASRVYQPQWRDDSLFHWAGARANEFSVALDILSKTGAGEGVRLPDKQGQWVDVGTYALNRLLDDPDFVEPEAVARRLFEATDPKVQSVYSFCKPETHVENVFAEVKHGLENPRNQVSVHDRVITGLGFLAHAARTDEALADRVANLLRDTQNIYLSGMNEVLDPFRIRFGLADLEAGRLGNATPEAAVTRLLRQCEQNELPDAMVERALFAWEKVQRSHYQGQWPARAPEVGLPPRLTLQALERVRGQYPEEAQAGAWTRLESMLNHLHQDADPAHRLQTAFEMMDAQQAYLSPGSTSVRVQDDNVQVGGVNVRVRKRN